VKSPCASSPGRSCPPPSAWVGVRSLRPRNAAWPAPALANAHHVCAAGAGATFCGSEPEEWRDAVGFTGYRVSSLGRVLTTRRRAQPVLLSPGLERGGYRYVYLSTGAGRAGKKCMYVHRLVLAAFVGPRPDGCETCHGNGCPSDNRLSNLRWDTKAANVLDKLEHSGLWGEVMLMRYLRAVHGVHAKALAEWFGRSKYTVYARLRGSSYAAVPQVEASA
jgi:hypothetical protein